MMRGLSTRNYGPVVKDFANAYGVEKSPACIRPALAISNTLGRRNFILFKQPPGKRSQVWGNGRHTLNRSNGPLRSEGTDTNRTPVT